MILEFILINPFTIFTSPAMDAPSYIPEPPPNYAPPSEAPSYTPGPEPEMLFEVPAHLDPTREEYEPIRETESAHEAEPVERKSTFFERFGHLEDHQAFKNRSTRR